MKNIKLGKIKIYGKEIDLDNIAIEDLVKIKKVLNQRIITLAKEYSDIYSNSNI